MSFGHGNRQRPPDIARIGRRSVNRRRALAAIVAAVAAPLMRPSKALATSGGLAATAAKHGRSYGCAIRIEDIKREHDLRSAVLYECSHIVPEVELSWAAIEPTDEQMSFAKLDELTAFAADNGKAVRGHTLLWHLGTPDWAVARLRTEKEWSLISRFFASVMPRYGDTIGQWTVVNEPMLTGHRMDGLRQNIFLEVFGPDYIERALAQARLFAPNAELIVNEFGLEYDIPEEHDRRYLFLKLLERLKRAGAPLDAVGLQAHLDLRKGSISPAALTRFLNEVAGLGLNVIVTELDVKEAEYTASVGRRDQLVADEVRRYLDVVLNQPRVTSLSTWGLTDRHSWLEVTPDDYARFPNAWTHGDGPGLNRGLPLDSSMQRKPLYYSIANSLKATLMPPQAALRLNARGPQSNHNRR